MSALSVVMVFFVWAACHRPSGTHEPEDGHGAETVEVPAVATIIVHRVEDDWILRAWPIVPTGNGGRLGSLELPRFEGSRDQGRLSIACPLFFLCGVGLMRADGMQRSFYVVGGAPTVEILIPGPLESSYEVRPRYLQPQSRSARIAALLEGEDALVQTCRATLEGSCGGAHLLPDPHRVVPGHDPHQAISRLRAMLAPEDEVFATWSYFSAGCPQSPIDAELARQALSEPIDPLARNLWPVGIARAILAAEGRLGAESRLEAMRAPADRELAAAILLELINEARDRHELERAVTLREALRAGEGPWKGSPLRESLLAQRSVVGTTVGSIPLRTLSGERRDPADMIGSPVLLYTAASWCAPCHRDGLPELRSLAAKHPDLAVLYVLWDEPEIAAAYVAEHAPVPGAVVLADDAARAKLEVLLGTPSFPSFLVIDAEGRVAALPGDDDLDTVVQRSGVLAAR